MPNFASDNTTGAAPEILAALAAANEGPAMPYGDDPWTARVEARLAEIFETDVAAFPVATGTAANALALSVVTPPYGVIYCHPESHVQTDECGAPEFYAGGAKLWPVGGAHGRIDAGELTAAITGAGVVHHAQPAALSLTQLTEAGTVYSLDAVAELAGIAHGHDLAVHMDGARFANALVMQGVSPAEAAWRAGVDVLSLGATKNGAWAAEAVVFFKRDMGDFAFRRKRAGHLFSKLRFISAQLDAYLADDLWLRNARHANAMAARLAAGVADTPGATILHPVEGNEIFVTLPRAVIAGLEADGFQFYHWGDPATPTVRLVAAWNTAEADVDGFVASARAHALSAAE